MGKVGDAIVFRGCRCRWERMAPVFQRLGVWFWATIPKDCCIVLVGCDEELCRVGVICHFEKTNLQVSERVKQIQTRKARPKAHFDLRRICTCNFRISYYYSLLYQRLFNCYMREYLLLMSSTKSETKIRVK